MKTKPAKNKIKEAYLTYLKKSNKLAKARQPKKNLDKGYKTKPKDQVQSCLLKPYYHLLPIVNLFFSL